MHCPICEQLTVEGVCGRCREDPQKVAAVLSSRMAGVERSYHTIKQVCSVCEEDEERERGKECACARMLHCPICEQLTVEGVCGRCREDPQKVAAVLSSRMAGVERSYHTIKQVCSVCEEDEERERGKECACARML